MKNFRCAICREEVADGLGTLTFDLKEGQVTLRNIPAKICPNGHQFFDGPTSGTVHRLLQQVIENMRSYNQDLQFNDLVPKTIEISAVINRENLSVA